MKMTFEEWLDAIVGTSSRRDHIDDCVDFAAVMTGNMSHNLARARMYEWLETAYQAGRDRDREYGFRVGVSGRRGFM
jgi:hypothetical protein